MLMRDRKPPPITSLAALKATRSSRPRRPAARCPPRISDCGDCGRSISTMRGVGAGQRRGEVLGAPRHRRRLPVAEARLEQRHQLGQRQVGDDEDRALSGRIQRLVEARSRSSRVSAFTASGSPMPENGRP